ncbi:putative lipid II flippase FtsW [Marinimicrobium sp. ABcell2]|uniref:putative lipid II flippase FtsW n=1 Tax=Marinimicrobium sp. ABcell2 TaxID=3069751 RepID=UPI00359CACC4
MIRFREQTLLSLPSRIDPTLLLLWLALLSIGLVMISSSSVAFAAEQYGDPWFLAKRHAVYLLMGLVLALAVIVVPVEQWQRYSGWLLLVTILLLVLVLIPGVGREVNGARRWIDLGIISIQVSEVAKFSVVVFFASYFARRHQELYTGWRGFAKPCLVIGLLAFLVLLEPDFGSAVVLSGTAFAMMFIAGVKLRHFMLLVALAGGLLAIVAITSPYRLQRLITFLDPWADQFNTGYQLTQSLIAFGRGEWFGLGLGNSLQKLFYLPEAHTDFIFSILAEEFGLVGVVIVIGLFAAMIFRMFVVARASLEAGSVFPALAVFGVAILITFQVFINVGVAAGLLPTKGLTLPFISYGGSSLLIGCALLALVLRVESELHVKAEPQVQKRPRTARVRRTVMAEAA